MQRVASKRQEEESPNNLQIPHDPGLTQRSLFGQHHLFGKSGHLVYKLLKYGHTVS